MAAPRSAGRLPRSMALAVALARLGRLRRLSGPGRGHWTAAGRSRSRREAAEAEAAAPVVQYVGERAARVDRVFVWGFSFSGALGVPSFVVPGSTPSPRAGSRPRRRVQPVPYRLELEQKVRPEAREAGARSPPLGHPTRGLGQAETPGPVAMLPPSLRSTN